MKINIVASKASKKNKEVAEILKSLKSFLGSVGIEKTLVVDDVYSKDREEMVRNILDSLEIGLSEKAIKNI